MNLETYALLITGIAATSVLLNLWQQIMWKDTLNKQQALLNAMETMLQERRIP
jgi:hypothetical protein